MTITTEMRDKALAIFFSHDTYDGGGFAQSDAMLAALDALAAMPDPGCDGCEYENMARDYFPCEDCIRVATDHYTPKEARE